MLYHLQEYTIGIFLANCKGMHYVKCFEYCLNLQYIASGTYVVVFRTIAVSNNIKDGSRDSKLELHMKPLAIGSSLYQYIFRR